MLHMEFSAEVVEGEEGVGEHQVLGAHGSGDEQVTNLRCLQQGPWEPNHTHVPSIAYLPGGLRMKNLSQQLLPISAEHIGAPAQQGHIPAHQL